MTLPDVPARLSLHAVSKYLLQGKTCWQNVQDEAIEGSEAAHRMVQAYQKEHTVSVQTLRAYLADLPVGQLA